MSKLGSIVRATAGYLRAHPEEVIKAAVNATNLRFGIPVAALRFAAKQLPSGKKMPTDVDVGTSPPAIRVGATLDAMGTPIRASGAIKFEGIEFSAETIKISVRLKDLKLQLLEDNALSPVALLIKSGVLDLSKPGNVVKHIPKLPPAIVEAEDDRITVDLMKVPKIAANTRLKKLLSILTPLVGIRAIETDGDHVYVAFRATPAGFLQAVDAVKKATE